MEFIGTLQKVGFGSLRYWLYFSKHLGLRSHREAGCKVSRGGGLCAGMHGDSGFIEFRA